MSIIYSYPEQGALNANDMLIGTSAEKVGGKQKNITRNFSIQQIADFINRGAGFVDPIASDFQIPVFNQEGKKITGSIMSQNIYPNGSAITIAGSLTATGAISTVNNLTASGIVSLGSQNNLISLNSITKLGGPIKDAAGTIGNVNQILLSNGSGNVTWTNYEAGLTYEGTWDANANTTNGLSNSPALLQGVGVSGHFYIVNVEGTTSLGPGLNDWHVGDWAVFLDEGGQPASWQKIDNTSTLVGSGTAGTFAKWTNATTLNDSIMSESGTVVSVDGDLKVKDTVEATTTNSNLKLKGNGTGGVEIMSADGTTDGKITLNCSQNSHGVTLQSPPHAAAQSWTWILPQTTGGANDVLTTDGNTPSQLSWTTPTTGTVTGTGTENYVTKWSNGGTGIEDSTIFDNGSVGIGTNNPSRKLHVSTNQQVTSLFESSNDLSSQINLKNGLSNNGGFIKTTGDDIVLTANNTTTSHLVVASGGNVGIGTSTPGSKLDVLADGVNAVNLNRLTNDGAIANFRKDGSLIGYIGSNTTSGQPLLDIAGATGNSNIRFLTTNTERIRITNTGNVGIGTTSPLVKTQISTTLSSGSVQDALLLSQNTSTSTSGQGVKMYLSSSNSISRAAAIEAIAGGSNDHSLGFYTNSAFSNPTEKMRIDSAGNVGIGTSSPSQKLDVASEDPVIRITNTKTVLVQNDVIGGLEFFTKDATVGASRVLSAITSDTTTGSASPNGNLIFKTSVGGSGAVAATEKMRINPFGNVGIGTSSPAVSLDISATDAVQMPVGVTGDRPTTGVASNGMLRYNSTNNGFEGYINGNWGDIGGGSSGGLVFRGTFDASTGAIASGGSLYTCPAGGSGGTVDTAIGDLYIVTTAGSFFCSGTSLNVGDEVICTTAALAGNSQFSYWNAVASGAGGAVTGSGTTNYVPKFTGATVVGNSSIFNDASGNVGIGTTTFNATYDPKLQVTSTANDGTGGILIQNYLPTLTLFDTSGGASASQLQQDGTNMVFKNSGSERMLIDTNGNVGIGTSSPNYRFTAYGSSTDSEIVASFGSSNDQNEYTAIGLSGFTAANGATKAGLALKRTSTYGTGELHFLNNNVTDNSDMTLSDSKMMIDSSGNVGIGTTSPDRLLVLNHDSDTRLKFQVNGIDTAQIQTLANEARFHAIGSATPLQFWVNGGKRMSIDSVGNVGIGTDSPVAKLEVKKGSTGQAYSNVEGILIDTNGTSNQYYGLRVGSSAGNANLAVTNAGNVGIGTDQPEVSLDLGSKNDAVALPAGDNTARGNIANPEVGMIRYNTTDYQFEGYSGVGAAATWGALGGGGAPTISKQLFQVTTATSIFVLNSPQVNPQDANYVNIFIDGVYQNSGTYTVATATGVTTVTLNTNAPVGTSVEIISTT